MRIPTFRPDLVVKVLKNRGVLLISETDEIILKGKVIESVVTAIDGKKTEDEIVSILASVPIGAAEIYYCLLQLEKGGYLASENPDIPAALQTFWQQAALDPETAFHAYSHAQIAVSAIGDVPVEPFLKQLNSLGIRTAKEGHLHIVLTDNYLSRGLEQLNEWLMAAHQPWLLVKPVGKQIWIGPLFYPNETGCLHCLKERLSMQRPLYQLTAEKTHSPPPLASHTLTTDAVTNLALQLISIEILRWFGSESAHPLAGALRSYDIHTHESSLHTLTRRPQCPACGNPELSQVSIDKQPLLAAHPKVTTTRDFRTVSAEATFEKYKHHISPITGIVKHLRQVEVPHPKVHVYSASHNMRPVSNLPADLPALLRDQSAGKGFTAAQAKTSALCEALERFSGVFQGNEKRVLASYRDLGSDAIHPNVCMLFSDEQYAGRDVWHEACNHPFQHVPIPFNPDVQIEWTPVWSLTLQRTRYLPTAYCYFNYKGPHPEYCKADSNGNAAGNTIEEAILQGYLELVERDAVSMWWYNRIQRPAVSLASFKDSEMQQMIEYYATLHRELWVLDITTDLNCPSFAAISRRVDRKPEDIIFGFGTHLNAQMAIRRALSEMNQLLPFVIDNNPDGSTKYAYNGKLENEWWQTAQIAQQTYLQPASYENETTRDTHKDWSGPDLKTDLQNCIQTAGNLGLEMLILDQTRPDVSLPVVKVFVPGLRVFWKRLAPGRLYDIPVKLGWIDEITPEDEMNPFPFFL